MDQLLESQQNSFYTLYLLWHMGISYVESALIQLDKKQLVGR